MTIFEQYDALCHKYKNEYGEDGVVVLLEVGSFYEIYGCDNGLRGCDVRHVCALLNIQHTKKNKTVQEVTPSNPELGGFPVAALPKYLPILVNAGYTVVLANQSLEGTEIRRMVGKIASKGTYIDVEPADRCVNLMSLYFQSGRDKRLHGCGVALIDLRTGKSHAFESCSSDVDDVHAVMDEVSSKISGYGICEVLMIGDVFTGIDDARWRLEAIGVTPRMIHNVIGATHDFDNPVYQNQILQKAYADVGLLSPAEYVGLERHVLALTAFVAVLDFAHKHDETLLAGIPPPVVASLSHAEFVKVSPNTLKNLDIVSDHLSDSIAARHCLSVLCDHCVTTIGKRLFCERLLRPITDVDELRKRYDIIDDMKKEFKVVRKALRGICDIDRVWRRTSMASGSLKDIPVLRETLAVACDLAEKFAHIITSITDVAEFKTDVSSVREALCDVTDDGNIAIGVFEDLDEARKRVDDYVSIKTRWIHALRKGLAHPEWVRDGGDEPCAHAICTPKRFEVIEPLLPLEFGDVAIIDRGKGAVKFTHAVVRNAASESLAARMHLDAVTTRRTKELQTDIGKRTSGAIRRISFLISSLDVVASAAKDAVENALVKPVILENKTSFVRCKGLRHPLAERINRGTPYVPNDVALDNETTGVLLYGVNAAGKSSLSKAVAVAVFMAQAGLHVACDSFEFNPFTSIYTRMASRDDIYRGKSTFMVELCELRDIIHRADEFSLVVGDELCSGTESASAISIVGSACLSLVKRSVRFVFATHLHELPTVKSIKAEAKIGVYHLGVRYDAQADVLVYERKLLPGPGKALYGLEVARAMHMGAEFMADAHSIRREILGISDDLVTPRTSHFNKLVYMDVCAICKERPAEETHHVLPQKMADDNGFINNFHKNALHNLIPLCGKCHDGVHANRLQIGDPMKTTNGILRL